MFVRRLVFALRAVVIIGLILMIFPSVFIVSSNPIKYKVVYASITGLDEPDYMYRNCLVYRIDYMNETISYRFAKLLDEDNIVVNIAHEAPSGLEKELMNRVESILNNDSDTKRFMVVDLAVMTNGVYMHVYVDENISDQQAGYLFEKVFGEDIAREYIRVFGGYEFVEKGIGVDKPVVIIVKRSPPPNIVANLYEILEELTNFKYSRNLTWLVGIGRSFRYVTLLIDFEKLGRAGLTEKEAIDMIRDHIGEDYPMIVYFVMKPLRIIPLKEQAGNENIHGDSLLDKTSLETQVAIPIVATIALMAMVLLYKYFKTR